MLYLYNCNEIGSGTYQEKSFQIYAHTSSEEKKAIHNIDLKMSIKEK